MWGKEKRGNRRKERGLVCSAGSSTTPSETQSSLLGGTFFAAKRVRMCERAGKSDGKRWKWRWRCGCRFRRRRAEWSKDKCGHSSFVSSAKCGSCIRVTATSLT